MSGLNADLIRDLATGTARERLAQLEVFAEIDSTNSYLMQIPGPAPGKISIAATSNQTAGRGRHGKTWQSPPGSGLCLSAAYTFVSHPQNLPALTLVLGVGVVEALQELGAADVEIKWPNDLVALDGKLGGILTEVHPQSSGAVTVVTGIGVNVDLGERLDSGPTSKWARRIVDMKSICDPLPGDDDIAARLTTHLLQAFVDYEATGLAAIADRWSQLDWLFGREIIVDTLPDQVCGIGAGIGADGALLVDTPDAGIKRVTSGSVLVAGSRDTPR